MSARIRWSRQARACPRIGARKRVEKRTVREFEDRPTGSGPCRLSAIGLPLVAKMRDSFAAKSTLAVGSENYSFFRLASVYAKFPQAERLPSANVTANLFGLLGVTPEMGRVFTESEDKPEGAPVALISYHLCQLHFSCSSAVLGQSITLDKKSYSIIGVLPPGFEILQQAPDVVVPF